MRHAAYEAGNREQPDSARHRRQYISDDPQSHQKEQESAPIELRRDKRHQRRAKHDPEGISGDRIRRGRNIDIKVGSIQLDDAHARELGRSDTETAQREREKRERLSLPGDIGWSKFRCPALSFVGFSKHRSASRFTSDEHHLGACAGDRPGGDETASTLPLEDGHLPCAHFRADSPVSSMGWPH